MSSPSTTEHGSRAGGRVMTVLGGVAGAAAGLATLSTVVTTGLDGSGTSSSTAGYAVAFGLLVVALVVAALGARMLGVRSAVARAGYAALVASSGFLFSGWSRSASVASRRDAPARLACRP